MILGTTPTHTFHLPLDTSQLKRVRITYKQLDKTLEKTEEDVAMEGKTISLTLTQEETLQFRAGRKISVQLKVMTTSGTVLATPIMELDADLVLNDEVLV